LWASNENYYSKRHRADHKAESKDDGLTLEEAAGVCGVSYAFLSALENGKETFQINKMLQVFKCLGLELEANVRSWANLRNVT